MRTCQPPAPTQPPPSWQEGRGALRWCRGPIPSSAALDPNHLLTPGTPLPPLATPGSVSPGPTQPARGFCPTDYPGVLAAPRPTCLGHGDDSLACGHHRHWPGPPRGEGRTCSGRTPAFPERPYGSEAIRPTLAPTSPKSAGLGHSKGRRVNGAGPSLPSQRSARPRGSRAPPAHTVPGALPAPLFPP